MRKLLFIAAFFITATSFKKVELKLDAYYYVVSAHLVYDDVPNCNKWLISNVAVQSNGCRLTTTIENSYEEYYIDKYKSKCGVREIYGKGCYTREDAETYRNKLIKEYKEKNRETLLTEDFSIPCQ